MKTRRLLKRIAALLIMTATFAAAPAFHAAGEAYSQDPAYEDIGQLIYGHPDDDGEN